MSCIKCFLPPTLSTSFARFVTVKNVLIPHRVYLLRGNHESKYCTSVYGFEKEVSTKYGDNGKHVYRKCLGCFEGLPLASIIAGQVYTAHGGLFRGTVITPSKRSKKKNRKVAHNPEVNSLTLGSFEELAKARRSVLDPPWEGQNLIPGDVLWSDPSMSPGLAPNKERGIGLLWGPDCTEEFLKKFNLKLIIRSHEGPDARDKRPDLGGMDLGYAIDHIVESGKLITLFSAPDYPQFQAAEERYRNKAAYIVLEPPHFDTPIFHSFEAVTPRPKVLEFLIKFAPVSRLASISNRTTDEVIDIGVPESMISDHTFLYISAEEWLHLDTKMARKSLVPEDPSPTPPPPPPPPSPPPNLEGGYGRRYRKFFSSCAWSDKEYSGSPRGFHGERLPNPNCAPSIRCLEFIVGP
ncbi:serine/threonine-protein phosphatase 7 [Phtheirospermum japonicum]|uniref:Serine/threonine-protein phosphatase n=1 Tax=Phtheirospermum japonicum TaxID=374723 RepID=A0A830CG48_9LAMI|nr:serine/threonine-protein phosphatase 7 [Phtheirospermum japonicum]